MRTQGMTGTLIVMVFLTQGVNAAQASGHDRGAYRFLYTQNNQDNTRTLFAAGIGPTGVERLKLDQQPYATYPWTDILCLCHNTLFGMNHSGLYSLALDTQRTTRLVCDVTPPYEQLTCLDNRAYGVIRHNNETQKIVILDFDRRAYRTFRPDPEPCANPAIAVSPSHALLAYHTHDPNGFRLTVIKTETGEPVCQSQPFDFQLPMIASVFSPPPLAWVDENRVLFIDSYTRGKFLSRILKKRSLNQLTVFHLDTGRFRHILSLPGNPLAYFPPKLMQQPQSQFPRLLMKTPGAMGDYRVDLKARKLVKDSIMGSPYALRDGRLLFKNAVLGYTKRHQVNVDPTGTRVVWLQNEDLYYHDNTRTGPIRVAEGCVIRGVTWIDPDASDGDLSALPLPHGWTPLE